MHGDAYSAFGTIIALLYLEESIPQIKVNKEVIKMRRNFHLWLIVLAMATLLVSSTAAQQKFTAALNSTQVVPATNSTARGSCDITFYPGTWGLGLTCEYTGLSGPLTAAHIHWAGVGQNGPITYNLGKTGATSGTFSEGCWFPQSFFPLLRSKKLYVELETADRPGGEIRGQIKEVTLDNDFDGDGRTDAFVYRTIDSSGWGDVTTYALGSVTGGAAVNEFNGVSWARHIPFLADFDGDGISDIASVNYQIPYINTWVDYVSSRDNSLKRVPWGIVSDKFVFGNYDGDVNTDIAVFRESDGIWYILNSGGGPPRYESWGLAGDRPCPGDYDGDGKTDLCVVRNEGGQLVWYIRNVFNSETYKVQWGLASDSTYPDDPVDVDGDGADDILVSRIEDGKIVFYALRSNDAGMFVLQWGLASDRIRLGDFDGDGVTDFAALRDVDSNLIWFVGRSSGQSIAIFHWGLPGDF